jgi:hypothetical protein
MSSATNPLQPWELRDQRFRESQAAQRGNNGQRSGSVTLSSFLQHTQQTNSEKTEQRAVNETELETGRTAEPSLARRGLTHEQKADMIEMFARFQSVSQVADMLKKDHGVTLDRRTIESFNPDSHRCRIGKRLKSLFILQRKAYVEECAKVAVSHQAHRLRLIGTIVEKAEKAKDFGNALKGLELAAKEMGGLSQTIEHKGMVAHVHGTVEDARRELADRLRQLIPVVDLGPCNVTEAECNVTGEDNGSADAHPMRNAALVKPALPDKGTADAHDGHTPSDS